MNPAEPIRPALYVDPAAQGEELDLRELLGTLSAGRWIIAVTAALFAALGALYLWLAAPVYRSDALVQVELKDKSINAALGDVAELLGGEAPVTAEMEILRSRMVVGKVVEALGLEVAARPRHFPVVGRAWAARRAPGVPQPALFGLDSFAWGGEIVRVTDLEVPPGLVGAALVLTANDGGFSLAAEDGFGLLNGKVGERATAETDYGPVAIFVAELTARPGTEFIVQRRAPANVIAGIQEELRVTEKGRQSGILGLTYEGTDRQRVAQVLHELVTAYQKQNVERRSAEAAQTLAFLEEQLPVLRKKLDEAEAGLNQYRLLRGSADLTKETELILTQSVTLEQGRLELGQKREEMLRRFTAQHPVIMALDAQLASLQREQGILAQQVKALPETQQELLRLARDVQVNTTLYTSLLNSAQELQVVKAGTVGNVRIIDFPQLALKPAKPQKALTLALSLMLGLMAGVMLVFLLRALHHGVYDPAVVEQRLGLATYATIPYSREQSRIGVQVKKGKVGKILTVAHPDAAAVEALRSLRTALHFALVEARNKVVMLTGPAPSLGKSFLAINLGALVAQTGKRVLVVDADLRRGHLHSYAGVDRAPGLSDYIAGDAAVEKVIVATSLPNLMIVPSGTVPPNPAELLLHERFGALFQAVEQRADLVLVDTPPVLAVTDAAVIGRHADSTLLVLKAGEHPLRAIEDSVRRLSQAGITVRGTVFNQVGGQGGYGYSYGHQYRYGYTHRKT